MQKSLQQQHLFVLYIARGRRKSNKTKPLPPEHTAPRLG
jgi:hypothetical protein